MIERLRFNKSILLKGALIGLLFFAYFKTIASPFHLPIDDDVLFLAPQVATPLTSESLATILTPGTSLDFYPVRDLSYALDHAVARWSGISPWKIAKVHQWLLFVETAFLLFGIIVSLGVAPAGSLVVTSLWALHPVHVEMVTWISARKDLLALVWVGWACFFTLRHFRLGSKLDSAIAGAAFLLACLSKGSPVLLPFAALLLRPRSFLLWVLLTIGIVSAGIHAHHYSIIAPVTETYGTWYRIGASFAALGQMAGGWIFPSWNVLDLHQWPPWLTHHRSWIPLGIFIWLIALSFVAIPKLRKSYYPALAFFFAAYLPVSGLLFPHHLFYSTRYFELPAVACLVAMASRIAIHWTSRTVFLAATLSLGLATLTHFESLHWTSGSAIAAKLGALTPADPGSISQALTLIEHDLQWLPPESKAYTSIVDQIALLNTRLDSLCLRTDFRTCNLSWSIRYLSLPAALRDEAPDFVRGAPEALRLSWPTSDRGRLILSLVSLQDDATVEDFPKHWGGRVNPETTPIQRLMTWAELCTGDRHLQAQEYLEQTLAKRLLTRDHLARFVSKPLSPTAILKLENCIFAVGKSNESR